MADSAAGCSQGTRRSNDIQLLIFLPRGARRRGVLFGKLVCLLTGGRVNPLIGAAGISAYPMAARVVQTQGLRYKKKNHLLMHAAGANTGGQIGSVVAAAVMLSVLKGMGLI